MDKISKFFTKITAKEKKVIKEILVKIKGGDSAGLDIKKLKGRNDIFRARKGSVRIIYQLNSQKEIFVLTIERRNEKTYKNLTKF